MKKPATAKQAESGRFGAEHRVRTGDLRLGKLAGSGLPADARNLKSMESVRIEILPVAGDVQGNAGRFKEVTAQALPHARALLSISEVASRLGVSRATVISLLIAQRLRCMRVGRTIGIDPVDLDAFIADQKQTSP